jgi:hypothetical protein
MAMVLKTIVAVTSPWVRIPRPPLGPEERRLAWAARGREMMAMQHLAYRGYTGSGLFLEGWPKDVFFVLMFGAVIGAVAIWNRSQR